MNTERYFYSVLKNEDATPFISDNLLIAADGLGGSGSTVHNILPVEGTTLHDEIYQAAFYDFDLEKSQGLLNYLEHWVYPMADGKPDTSALWASRIVIARCAYALCYNKNFINADLSSIAVREQLAKFISIGLDSTALHFSLERGKYDDQKVLPTTLAFVRYTTDKQGVTVAEVVWAGDSRCYLLTQNGLKQLSIDDEDKSGAITNLLFVGGKKPTVLNYRKYEIKEPCVLMAVSDGIFDPFEPHDNLGVEKTLLEHIAENDSYEGLMQSLSEFYDKVHGDDATMAFVSIGFADYKSLRKSLEGRNNLITEIWQKLYEMNAALEVVDQSEEDIRSYVESRTRDKFQAIITTLLASYKDHSDDLAYTEEIIGKIATIKSQLADKQKKDAEHRVKNSINELRNYVKAHIEEKVSDIFARSLDFDVPNDIASIIYRAKREYDELCNALEKKIKMEKTTERKASWRSAIKEREEYYWRLFNEYRYDISKIKSRSEITRYLKAWMYIDIHLEQGYFLSSSDINNLDGSDKRLAKEIDSYICKNKAALMISPTEIEETISNALKRYRVTIDKLFDGLLKMPQICKKVFVERIVKQFALLATESTDKSESIGGTDISVALISQKDEVSTAIVNALAKHYDRTSILDMYYNATRLNAFRTYYKAKMSPNTDVAEFDKRLQALEAEYKQLIAKASI